MKTIGFAGFSGSGKTTLIEQLIPWFNAQGLRVSLIKHAHHDFDVDQPGKDSYRHRAAGAAEVLVSSAQRWVLMHELRAEPEPDLAALTSHLAPCDLLIVEGFKMAAIPKIEVWRASVGKPRLALQDPHIVALATDQMSLNCSASDLDKNQAVLTSSAPVLGADQNIFNGSLPVLDLAQADQIGLWIKQYLAL